MNETRQLAQFAAGLDFKRLPSDVVQAAKVFVLDCLACGLVAPGLPWSRMVADLAREAGASGPCTVFGQPWRTSAPYAALANGVMIGGFETDHVYGPGSCHPGAAVFPALLAIAEKERLDGRRFLAALVAGYEVVCRIGLAAGRAVEDRAGFHGPAANGPFGAATAVARALGLDAERTASALGIAGSHGGGLMEFSRDGSMIKRLHVGRASHLGLESALLAQKGFTGPHTVLEGPRGFLRVFSPDPHPDRLLDGLGDRYLMASVLVVKTYPAHVRAHPFIQALARFRSEHTLDPRQVRRIQIVLDAFTAEHHGAREPATLLAAQYSVPYSVAVALWRDIAADPLAYDDSAVSAPDIQRTASQIELVPSSTERALVLDEEGQSHRLDASDFKGSPTDPYTFDELCDKFRRYAAASVDADTAGRIIEAVRSLESLSDISALTRMLAPREG